MPKKQTSLKNTHPYDVAIIGAGPAGLALACMLDRAGLRVIVLEKQDEASLSNPAYDGRDIALTQRSLDTLVDIGAMQAGEGTSSPIRHARVLNGTSHYSLHFEGNSQSGVPLGYIIPNNIIRKGIYGAFQACRSAILHAEVTVKGVAVHGAHARVSLADGRGIDASLVVSADSRFSEMRRKMGISARMHDFGRVCIVCRMTLAHPHDETAYECFQFGQTLAVLPVAAKEVSVVLTLASDKAEAVMAMSDAEFNADVTDRFEARFGAMRLSSPRHAYPLVAVYADRFHAARYALVGDAAVGMHPVTAHGFNFGLMGAVALTKTVVEARACGLDIGAPSVLAPYTAIHRRATRPLYLATNAIVKLYTDDRRPARIAREALLHLGNALTPVRKLITGSLMRVSHKKAA